MKLNLHILYDEMKTPGCRLLAGDDIALDLQGVRLLPDDSRQLSPNYIYVTSAERLRRHAEVKPGANILCVGEMDPEFLLAQGWKAIVLQDGPGEYAAFELVQNIFDKYRSWNEELTAAILQKEPLQTVLDIGTRYLWNPIALFDSALTFIAKAGPPLPDNIAKTIWEDVLEKGYSPMEKFSPEERAVAQETVRTNRNPYLVTPPRAFIDKNFLIVSVFRDEDLFGTIAGSDINKPYSLGQISILRHFRNMLELFIKNNGEFANIDVDAAYFLDRVLQGFSIEPNVVSYYLSKRGWKLQGDYRLFFFAGGKSDLRNSQQGKHLVFRIGNILSSAMVFLYENEIVAIEHGIDSHRDEAARRTLVKFLKEIDLRAGISMVFPSFMDLKYAYIQSKTALKEGTSRTPNEYLFEFQGCYSDHVIHALDEVTSLKSLCHPRLLQMALQGRERERETIRSLRLYLFNGRNVLTTAAMLHIHRNTLMYRLQQIEKLLDLDLKALDEQAFFSLYLTCLITDYLSMGHVTL